jgi:hypothetical protein
MPVELTFTFQMGGITLQMLALPYQMHWLSPIEMCGTICQNGVLAMMCKLSIFFGISHYNVLSSPQNPKELFNMHHVLARNVIKQIFGILKWHFWILQIPMEYDMRIQVLIPSALAALYNFIWQYEPGEIHIYDYMNNPNNPNDDDKELLDVQMGVHPKSLGELGLDAVMPHKRV